MLVVYASLRLSCSVLLNAGLQTPLLLLACLLAGDVLRDCGNEDPGSTKLLGAFWLLRKCSSARSGWVCSKLQLA